MSAKGRLSIQKASRAQQLPSPFQQPSPICHPACPGVPWDRSDLSRLAVEAVWRDLRCAIRVPHLFRSTTTFSFVISEADRTVPSFPNNKEPANIQEPETAIPLPLFLNVHQFCTSAASPGSAQQTKLKLSHG